MPIRAAAQPIATAISPSWGWDPRTSYWGSLWCHGAGGRLFAGLWGSCFPLGLVATAMGWAVALGKEAGLRCLPTLGASAPGDPGRISGGCSLAQLRLIGWYLLPHLGRICGLDSCTGGLMGGGCRPVRPAPSTTAMVSNSGQELQ